MMYCPSSPLLLLLPALASAAWTNTADGRSLVVLNAPSVWDNHYSDAFLQLIHFTIEFANRVRGHDNIVVLADKHTMPYLDGRTHKVKGKLPDDVLLEADVYDVKLRDFAPMGIRELAKYQYINKNLDEYATEQIDLSFKRFIKKNNIRVDREEKTFFVNGANIIDNGESRAIVNADVITDNQDKMPDWAALVKLLAVFKQVALVHRPGINTTTGIDYSTRRLDDLFAFIDHNNLLVVPMDAEERVDIETLLRRKFYNDINLLDVPDMAYTKVGSCGFYTTLLATQNYLYMPVFGNDPDNWSMGHSTMTDKMMVQLVHVNTQKQVVPINVPYAVCSRGLGLRALGWNLHGASADGIVQAARWSGRRRSLRLFFSQ